MKDLVAISMSQLPKAVRIEQPKYKAIDPCVSGQMA